MLDLNTEHDFCGLSEASVRWVEQQLAEAQEAGAAILAAGHQNLFQHSIFRGGYVFSNAEKVAALFEQYGVRLYLSGHLHIQHILTENGVTEIASSALCSYPCQYGLLHAAGDSLRYETRQLDMADWAERNGITDELYRDFPAAAAAYMIEHFKGAALPPAGVGPEEWEQMQDYLLSLNLAFFSGESSRPLDFDS
jgi:3',5'-cyclic AMP phosphodiesterase CpdA